MDRETIKWDADLDRHRHRQAGVIKKFSDRAIIRAAYRPFTQRWLYFDRHFNGRSYQQPALFGLGLPNTAITWSDTAFSLETIAITDAMAAMPVASRAGQGATEKA
ncbi:MAG: hypothetical protein KA085_19450 [Phenylobacterium sp.]|uniref:type ISP restriction/modification enzyme n=1 Tax=Phenylobacterium sp. TaxID=1871053 RepID=UPI001B789C70|nr:hypothetical protein [Phenylobacterium sp.]